MTNQCFLLQSDNSPEVHLSQPIKEHVETLLSSMRLQINTQQLLKILLLGKETDPSYTN